MVPGWQCGPQRFITALCGAVRGLAITSLCNGAGSQRGLFEGLDGLYQGLIACDGGLRASVSVGGNVKMFVFNGGGATLFGLLYLLYHVGRGLCYW